MANPMSNDTIGMAVEIAKAGMPIATGTMILNPDAVAKFIDVVAKKIHELKNQGG